MPERRTNAAGIIGLISDTHGLLRPEALRALEGVDRIVHAGDVGKPEVIAGLERVAPVIAVRGNVDGDDWPERATVDPGILVLHDVKQLKSVPAGIRAVVSGHSHKSSVVERAGVLYINPGAAGPRRFRLPLSVGRLYLPDWRVEIVELPV